MNNLELKEYINNKVKNSKFTVSEIKGDASKRKYYRAKEGKNSLIIMDSSLEKRNFNNFLKYTELFKNNNIKVPNIISKDSDKKILIIEDLGNNLIYDKTNKNNLLKIYKSAIKNILNIQKIKNKNISFYKKEKYFSESSLFIEWVIKKFINLNISKSDENRLIKSLNFLVNSINNKSNKLVHRDYHSKNIFFKDDKITIIDYQDSLYGSPIYDLVSLLNDCYRDIDHKQKNILINYFLSEFNQDNKVNFSKDEFIYNFNLISAQRHMKASGIFCRLSIKNNRHNYLQHLNRTFNYILKATSCHVNLKILNFFTQEVISNLNESNYSSSR
jgi:aminoglycoside/choline kinase family phosphotransferase